MSTKHSIRNIFMLILTLTTCFVFWSFPGNAGIALAQGPQPEDIGLPPPALCTTRGPADSPYEPGINCRYTLIDNYPRTFIVFVPPNLVSPAPVVFLFHGTNGDGDGYLRNSGWVEKARQEGIILVSGSGLKYCHVGYSCENGGLEGWESKWHHYHLPMPTDPPDYNIDVRYPGYPGEPAPWPADDVKFTEFMMDDVSEGGNGIQVDTDRFYVSGFSGGAGFSARLAVEIGDRLAAVGYSSGGLIDVSNPPEPAAQIPVFALIGTNEPGILQITYGEGNSTPLPLDSTQFLALDSLMSYYVIPQLDGYEHHYSPNNLTPVDILEGNHHTLYRWQTGGTDQIFQLGVLEGLMHAVPNGCERFTNPFGFVGPDIFWNFFQSAPDYPFVSIPTPSCPNPS